VATPGGDWSTLVSHEDRRAVDATIFGREVAYALEDGDWRAVYVTDLDGRSHDLLVKDDADFSDLTWSPDGGGLAAIRTRHGQADLVTIAMDGAVETIAEGGFWQTPQWAGGSLIAVYEAHDTAPKLMSLGAGEQRALLDGAPAAVLTVPHRPFERLTYTTSDGLDIEGFLFRPEDTSRPVPAVVYPHGGPTSVYGDEWDGHAQYFIDKGYAWFAINFRGSTSYGLGLERANHDDWGIGDTIDCIEAGRYLQSLDWVDGDRIAIFGASYGSYLALTSLVHPENPFACGIAKYGDCDILTSWAQGDRTGGDDLQRMMGHPSENRSGYRVGSPIHEIDRIDRPILVAHGEKDARVNVKQAEELVTELRRRGKRYEYVTYPLEGHGFLRRDSQIDFYKRLERFLDWHLM
jgi:dipeptidyl aminopeptidase/acylaminoacyl peptidase